MLGKKDFTSRGLIWPNGIAFDSGGNLWVAGGLRDSISEFKPLDRCSDRGVRIVECHQYLNELANVYADAKNEKP